VSQRIPRRLPRRFGMANPSSESEAKVGSRSRMDGTSSLQVGRSTSLRLTRTQSDYARTSLARMASLETAHLTSHPKDNPEEADTWSDDKHQRLDRCTDLETGHNVSVLNVGSRSQSIRVAVEHSAMGFEDVGSREGTELNGQLRRHDSTGTEVAVGAEHDQASPELVNNTASETPSKREGTGLQDQTNLLPARQIILVFLGLSCALFVSLLDQTMYVEISLCRWYSQIESLRP